jgi:hypothetical protein
MSFYRASLSKPFDSNALKIRYVVRTAVSRKDMIMFTLISISVKSKISDFLH